MYPKVGAKNIPENSVLITIIVLAQKDSSPANSSRDHERNLQAVPGFTMLNSISAVLRGKKILSMFLGLVYTSLIPSFTFEHMKHSCTDRHMETCHCICT